MFGMVKTPRVTVLPGLCPFEGQARILPGYHPAAQIQYVGIAERHERARASALMRPLLQ